MTKDSIIYIAPDCHECEIIQRHIENHNVEVSIQLVNPNEILEKGIFVFPALVENGNIVAYGNDIINYLVK